MRFVLPVCLLIFFLISGQSATADGSPAKPSPLPEKDGAIHVSAQEWPLRPGPRPIRVLVHYPGGRLDRVNPETGIMLTLHNWGGTDCVGTAAPNVLADELNVIAICVNYLQSGKVDSIDGPEPYDFGYLQALDALRALWSVRAELKSKQIAYADDRLYCTGGSGGGNVTLMANKLAPRTFACVIDLCGMKKLSDDIAFNLPGGSGLNARWKRDPADPGYLSGDAQELRYLGHPVHLRQMKLMGATARIITVHGVDDTTCPYGDAVEMAEHMREAGIDVEPVFVTSEMLDGSAFQSTGHALGDRTQIVLRVAGKYLRPGGEHTLRRAGPSDFERREPIRYTTARGSFVVSWDNGYPEAEFEAAEPPPEYPNHDHLLEWRDATGRASVVDTAAAWEIRRGHIRQHLQRAMGSLPSPLSRVPLRLEILEEVKLMPPEVNRPLVRRKLMYWSDETSRVPAYLFLPLSDAVGDSVPPREFPAVLCLQQTTEHGKAEVAGLRGDPDMKYAIELAELGFVTLAPDYPSFGDYQYDFSQPSGYSSGSMKAVWDNIRAVDLLESLPEVDASRIGCIGHSLGGHNAIFTAVFEERLKVVVSSCGFSSFAKDDLPSWTGPRYMPAIAAEFGNERARVPFDFHELVASLAPRAFLACIAEQDEDFSADGVRDVMKAASQVYRLLEADDCIATFTVSAPHSFPATSREAAYGFLCRHLGVTSDAGNVVTVRGNAELRRALSELKAGTVLRIAPGDYDGGHYVRKVSRLTVEALDPAQPPLFAGGDVAWQFSECDNLIVRNLRISGQKGNGLNIDNGGDNSKLTADITLDNIQVSNIGPRGNTDGIKGSGLKRLTIRNCVIMNWGGEGIDLVGCHDSLLTACRLESGEGYSASAGIQMKGGSSGITVEKCILRNAGQRPLNIGGSTGLPYFRPADATSEASAIAVRGNRIEGSLCAAAFVGVDGAVFEDNTILNPAKWIFRILQETTDPRFVPCRNVQIRNNRIVFQRSQVATDVNVGAGTEPASFRFHGNMWFAEDRPTRSTPQLPVAETEGVYGRDPR